MKTLIIVRHVYDPVAKKIWLRHFHISFSSREELSSKIADLNRQYPRWEGQTGRG